MLRRSIRQIVFCCLLAAFFCNGLAAVAQNAAPSQSAEPPPAAKAGAPSSSVPTEKLSLSDQVIQDILEPIRSGLEGQNVQQVMSAFERQGPDYGNTRDQLGALFQMYNQIRFRYQILQVTSDKGHGSATAEFQMDALPYDVTQVAVRRSVQMRLQIQHGANGWKIVGLTPPDFFSLEVK